MQTLQSQLVFYLLLELAGFYSKSISLISVVDPDSSHQQQQSYLYTYCDRHKIRRALSFQEVPLSL